LLRGSCRVDIRRVNFSVKKLDFSLKLFVLLIQAFKTVNNRLICIHSFKAHVFVKVEHLVLV